MSATFTRRETGNLSAGRLDRLIDIDELADRLSVSKATIYGWCHRRQIPFFRLGKRSLFDPVELENWLDARRVGPIGGPR